LQLKNIGGGEMKKEKIEKEVKRLMANGYLKAGKVGEAVKIYAEIDAEPIEEKRGEISAFAEECLRVIKKTNIEKLLEEAEKGSWEASREIDVEETIEGAVNAFKTLSEKEKLIEIGEKCLEIAEIKKEKEKINWWYPWYSWAQKAFQAAGAKDKSLSLGERCLQERIFGIADDAFRASGEIRKYLLALGDKCLEKKNFAGAFDCYKEAFEQKEDLNLSKEAEAKILQLGEICTDGVYEVALESFITIGRKDKLVALGDKCLKEKADGIALRAYKAASSIEKLISLGEEMIKDSSRILGFSWAVKPEDAFRAAAEVKNKE